MNYVDYIFLILIVLMGALGYKNGMLKGLLNLVVLLVSGILSYTFKGVLSSLMMRYLPFLSFNNGLKSLNIMFYNGVAFFLIFVIVFCLFSILLNFGGVVTKILNRVPLKKIPDKLGGVFVGLIEGFVFSYLITFLLIQVPYTQSKVYESKYGSNLLERTPIIRVALSNTTVVSRDVIELINKYDKTEDKESLEIDILNTYIKYKLVSSDDIQKFVDNGKFGLKNIEFSIGEDLVV